MYYDPAMEMTGPIEVEMTHSCWRCSRFTKTKCSQCKVPYYCGRKCQTEDCPRHKVFCKPPEERLVGRHALVMNTRTWKPVIRPLLDGEVLEKVPMGPKEHK